MIKANGISLRFGEQTLFENVNIKFIPGNCYGLIGANGSGKSTFLKILSGEIEANKGDVVIAKNHRLAVLNQNQYEFDEYNVLNTVIKGHKRLNEIIEEKEHLYEKEDFTEADGIKISELETEFAELDGWEAESQAIILLNGLGIKENIFEKKMAEIESNDKIRVLLAQALFGNPQILLLDEPTNHLDVAAITWLENFLFNFGNTVIVVSHDRHFLNKVCTHIADIDFSKIKVFPGNYNFWYQSSQLVLQQMKDYNKKTEAKRKDLEAFIQRFSANASKSKQATSRKKQLEKLTLEDIKPSSRKYPFIDFKPEREIGNDLLEISDITKQIDGINILDNISFMVNKGDKIALVGSNSLIKTTLFKLLMGELSADSGTYKWGITTTQAYFPKDNSSYFDGHNESIIDWLRQYSTDKDDTFIRGWLGRMLFSGEDAKKQVNVLSGGERVRCMLSKMMLSGANILILDEPTNHLDLESITALNDGLIKYKGTLLFASHDHKFVHTVANRIIEITPKGIIDRQMSYDEYLENEDITILRKKMYS
ncbi:MAG: ATP-binding cassette domain-containing protein [Clostridiales bacterium]|nr:ATP-binding cassette domain-containing protein [Clostridiales bacterium]